MASVSAGRVKILKRGVVDVMKSDGVFSFTKEHVDRLAAKANAQAEARRASMPPGLRATLKHASRQPGSMESPPYKGVTYRGNHDTLGAVRAATLEGGYDQNQHHTLDSLGH